MFTIPVSRSRTPRQIPVPLAPRFVDIVTTAVGYIGFSLDATGDSTLYWGDGDSDTVAASGSPSFSHTYTDANREASFESTANVTYCGIDVQVSEVYSVEMAAGAFSQMTYFDLTQADNSTLLSINLLPFTELTGFNCQGGGFDEAAVDQILSDLVANGKLSGFVDIAGSVAPGAAGDADALTLIGRGWTVNTD